MTSGEGIDELLDEAGVPRSNDEARKRLAAILHIVEGLIFGQSFGIEPPKIADQRDSLERVQSAAKKLRAELDRLNKSTLRHQERAIFWTRPALGDLPPSETLDDLIRPDLLAAVETLEQAATEAIFEVTHDAEGKPIRGRQPAHRDREVFGMARGFFVTFAPDNLSSFKDGKFGNFMRTLYSTAARRSGRKDPERTLDGLIKEFGVSASSK